NEMGRSLAPKPVIVEGVPQFKRPTAKGVGLRVADSRTGNHPEDDFTLFETFRRLCSVFGRRSHLGFEGETSEPKGRVRHQASQSNVIAYGDEPTVNLLCSFLNLGRAGDSLTLSNRGLKTSCKHSPKEPVIYYWGQEMDFRSFMMQEMDGEFKFLFEGCIDDNQCSPSSKSVNNEAPVIGAKQLTSVHPSDFVKDVADSDDASAGDNENPLVGTSLPPLHEAGKKLISLDKRKLPSRVGDSLPKVQKMVAQTSKVAGEASDPPDVDSDPDIHGTSLTQELISALYKATALRDAIQARELKKDKKLMLSWRGSDRASVIAKVVSDAAIKLIRSDEIGMLVAKLVKASIIYGRWAAFGEVAKLKKAFVMEKMAGYCPSSKQECDQDGDDLANASRANVSSGVVFEGLMCGPSSPPLTFYFS
nr:hypothetical protein [Tanacetum cinerariifolium]